LKISPRYILVGKTLLVVIVLVLLWQFVKTIDPAEVQAALEQVGAGFGWVILSTLVAYTLGTLGWLFCLGREGARSPLAKLFMIRHVCETVGLFNPASFAGGDMLKVVLLRPYLVSQPTVITSVIISRLLMIVSQICLLIVVVVWLAFAGRLETEAWPMPGLGTIAIVLGAVGLLIFSLIKLKNTKLFRRLPGEATRAKVKAKITPILAELREFYRKYPRQLVWAFICFTLHWIVGSLEFYIVLKLFGYDVSVADGILLDMGVIVVKAAGAFVPGQIGVEELGNKIMLSLIGIASIPLWISVSALRRTRQVFWILVGAVFYSFLSLKRRPVRE
jgi:glycosyltransferase 2 family protein